MLRIRLLFLTKNVRSQSTLSRRELTNDEIREHRLRIFERERQKQYEQIRRLEKIEIDVQDPIQSKKLLMNKHVSTPLDCAKHLSSILVERSCLALINNETIWDMNRPLQNDCQLKFLHFKDENCEQQNRAYWRTCSFVLGFILENAFKSQYPIELCSFPPPSFQYGSFAYDVQLNLPDWKPTNDDLRCLSIQAYRLRDLDLPFQRLQITESVAEEMFRYDQFKLQQIPQMVRLLEADDQQKRLVVYRMGNHHVDITQGPLISSTKQFGRFEFAAIHNIDVPSYQQTMQRVQALSIPNQLHLHFWTFDFLLQRAKKRNLAPIPTLQQTKNNVQQTQTN